MKRNVIVALAVAGVVASSGVALAGGKAPAQAKAPEPNTWEYAVALEMGNLPADFSKVDTAKNAISRDADPVIEVGGRVYRVGVDTQ